VTGYTHVWREGMPRWAPVAKVPELASELSEQIAEPASPPAPPQHQTTGRSVHLPVDRSGMAVAAGYLGLLSILPFFGLLSVLISIMAILDIKKDPSRYGMGRAVFGLLMGIACTAFWGAFFVWRSP